MLTRRPASLLAAIVVAASTSLLGCADAEDLPPDVEAIEFEGELCLVRIYDAEVSCDTPCGRCVAHCYEVKCSGGRGEGGCDPAEAPHPSCGPVAD